MLYYLDITLLRFAGRISGFCESRSKHRSIRSVVTTARLSALGVACVEFALGYPEMYPLIFMAVDAERI